MYSLILALHIFVSLFILGLVLIQNGKGADPGSGFGVGGASQNVFGSQGSLSFLVKLTGACAVVFFITSLTLGLIKTHSLKTDPSLKLEKTTKTGSSTPIGPPIQPIQLQEKST